MNAAVLRLQENLATQGLAPGPIDGLLGPQTLRSLCWIVSRAFIGLADSAYLWAAMQDHQITTPLRVSHFLANCGAESEFRLTAENLNYSAGRLMIVWPTRFPTPAAAAQYAGQPFKLAEYVYGGRMGNAEPGDGYKYRGRGWCQLTGRDAYRIIGGMTGLPLLDNPDLLLTPKGAAYSAAAFWDWKQLSPLADMDDGSMIRQRWNGGMNGWPTVQAAVARLKAAWS